MVTATRTTTAAKIPPAILEDDASSVGVDEKREVERGQLIPLQSSVGVEEEVKREQLILLQSSVGEKGRIEVAIEREQSTPLQSSAGNEGMSG